jgi:hypothetical protein
MIVGAVVIGGVVWYAMRAKRSANSTATEGANASNILSMLNRDANREQAMRNVHPVQVNTEMLRASFGA